VPVVDVECRAFLLETHPAVEHQLRETLARLAREGADVSKPRPSSGASMPSSRTRPTVGDVDGVAVDHRSHQQRFGTRDARRRRE